MSYTKWTQFADATVRMLAQIKPGQSLLILADTRTDLLIAEACLAAGMNAGADAQLMVFPYQSQTSPHDFGPMLSGAIKGANVVIGLCETLFAQQRVIREARAAGTRVLSTVPKGIEDYVIDGLVEVDYPRMIEVGKQVCDLWEKTTNCQVTSDLGTDLHFQLAGRPCRLGDGMVTEDGEVDFFPGVQVSIAPVEDTIEGTMVIDGSVSPGGIVGAPITARLERGVIADITGGTDANAWRARLEGCNDPTIFHLCHFSIGLNPRAKMTGNMIEDERVVGAVTFGFGNQDPAFKGTVGSSKFHVDVVLASPTIILDGKVMVERNRLNPEMGLSPLI